MENNQTQSKPADAEQPSPEGLSSSALLGAFWCSYGQVQVHVGDEFALDYPPGLAGKWKVEGEAGHAGYSPSGLGGTRAVVCTQRERSEDFCADSVAAAIHRTRNPGKSYTELQEILHSPNTR